MELIKQHETTYERHKKTSMLISIIVLILVTFSFCLSSISPTRKMRIKQITVNSSNYQKQHFEALNFTNFHTFFDLYAEVFIPTSNLESIKVESSVELPNHEVLMEKQTVYDVKCPEGVCEPILLISVNPVRNEKYLLSTMINTEHMMQTITYTAHYQSYHYVVMMISFHLVMLVGNVIVLMVAFGYWRKKSRNEWYFEHIYVAVVMFFQILYNATYPFYYIYESKYISWALQLFDCLSVTILFLYYIVMLSCMASNYKPSKGTIFLSVMVGIGQLACTLALIMYNGIYNIKSCTVLNPPTESYVLIAGLAFCNVLYIAFCIFQAYNILRNTKGYKQIITHILFFIPVAVILICTTYNSYYMSLVPKVSLKSTITIACEIFLIGLFVLTFGKYSSSGSNPKYSRMTENDLNNQIANDLDGIELNDDFAVGNEGTEIPIVSIDVSADDNTNKSTNGNKQTKEKKSKKKKDKKKKKSEEKQIPNNENEEEQNYIWNEEIPL